MCLQLLKLTIVSSLPNLSSQIEHEVSLYSLNTRVPECCELSMKSSSEFLQFSVIKLTGAEGEKLKFSGQCATGIIG